MGNSVTIGAVQSALGIEGNRLYVVVAQTDPQTKVDHAIVQALSLETLQSVASYPLSQVPQSVAAVDNRLVFGAHTALFVASPGCP